VIGVTVTAHGSVPRNYNAMTLRNAVIGG